MARHLMWRTQMFKHQVFTRTCYFAAQFSLQHGGISFKAAIFCESDSQLMFPFSSYDPPNDATSEFKKQDNMFLQYCLAQL